jgi:hypothetical protein
MLQKPIFGTHTGGEGIRLLKSWSLEVLMSNDLVEKGVSIGYLLFTVPFLPTMNAPSGMSAQSQG